MVKAEIYCPHEQVFIYDNLLGNVPVLPGTQKRRTGGVSKLEVDVLEISGDKALVLLPSILAKGQETALVEMQYVVG